MWLAHGQKDAKRLLSCLSTAQELRVRPQNVTAPSPETRESGLREPGALHTSPPWDPSSLGRRKLWLPSSGLWKEATAVAALLPESHPTWNSEESFQKLCQHCNSRPEVPAHKWLSYQKVRETRSPTASPVNAGPWILSQENYIPINLNK